MVPMARMRVRCLSLVMSATRRRTGARGRRIVDEKGVTGQADGVNYVELTGMRGRRNNVGHSVGAAAAAMKMIGVRMTKGPIACMRIFSTTLRRVRTTVNLQLARDSGVAPREGGTRSVVPARAGISGSVDMMLAKMVVVAPCKLRVCAGGRGSTPVHLLRRDPRSPAAVELKTAPGVLRRDGLAARSGKFIAPHVSKARSAQTTTPTLPT